MLTNGLRVHCFHAKNIGIVSTISNQTVSFTLIDTIECVNEQIQNELCALEVE